ncbi:DUF7882 family protein [Microbacterium sp.]|uniref:DUF7882 family protein n=1 Tax=Microbacterium sp. TaxID=51671 RepID=UPI002810C96C|nr:hypothetical protein [Microbacterium sp.]
MGRMKYDGSGDEIVIDDVALAHLKIVITTKLRRQESFMMTWFPVNDSVNRKRTIWIHPAIPLQFGFDTADSPPIDSRRIHALMERLNATGELLLDGQAVATTTEPALA